MAIVGQHLFVGCTALLHSDIIDFAIMLPAQGFCQEAVSLLLVM